MKSTFTTLILTLLFHIAGQAQTKVTLSGSIKDQTNGEDMIGASIFLPGLSTGVTTNVYGFYSITIPKGDYEVVIAYIGYESLRQNLSISKDTIINFQLNSNSIELKEVVISDRKPADNLNEVRIGAEKLTMDRITKMPAFFGEVDILKAIQTLPGVQSGGEGTSGYFVRGGTVDQNLIQLDEATVYNASHLMGFFSVFNPDAIKDVELYKGGIPAQYGGRLSSVLDIRMKEGNQKQLTASGGIGTIASRFTIEGPVEKDISSFIISGRRTYADLFLKLSSDEQLRNSKLYFYDLNAKMNFKIGKNDRLLISGYFGDDVFKYKDMMNMNWGNATGTLRWNHLFNEKLFANFTFLYSNFNYGLGSETPPTLYDWRSKIEDKSIKADFSYYPSTAYILNFGISAIYHQINPGIVIISGENFTKEINIDIRTALESAAYLSSDITLTEKLGLQPGIRFSMFQNLGGVYYSYQDGLPIPTDTATYQSNKVANTYNGIEPRLIIRYKTGKNSSVKLSYNSMTQYLHLATNTTASFPLDVYIPSSPNVKPQRSSQVALGYFRNFVDNSYEFSAEFFHKNYRNLIDFRDNADLLLNKHIEREIVNGNGQAYGAEFFLKKPAGKLNGWISYTWTRSNRQIKEINYGKSYLSRQDRPHSLNLLVSYQLRERLHLGVNWMYASGMPVTLPDSRYLHDGILVPVYSSRNSYRLPASHRLDLSLTLKNKKKPGQKWDSEWNLSVYNAYARKNPFTLQTRQNSDDPSQTEAVQLSIIGTIIPSVTYNFKF